MAVYRAPEAAQPPKKQKKGHLGLILLLILALAVIFAAVSVMGDIKGSGTEGKEPVTVTVEQGSGVSAIASRLKEAGVIKYPQVFKLWIKGQDGLAQKLQYGDFALAENMGYAEAAHVLATQTVAVETVRLTFPEGLTALAIADQMELAGLCSAEDFLDVACNGDFSRFEFWNHLEDDPLQFFKCEGYLFPDTYDFAVEDTVENYVATFYARFDEQVTDEMYARMDELGMSLDEIITLASFVQEEAGNEEDEKVSAVFHNRLAEDSPFPRLESNASSYVENPEDNNYLYNWIGKYYGGFDQIPADKYEAYNTYSCTGLPAGPISNPGVEAIKAALWPDEDFIKGGYYFFVTDLNGKYYYGKTVSEHSANVNNAYAVNKALGQ